MFSVDREEGWEWGDDVGWAVHSKYYKQSVLEFQGSLQEIATQHSQINAWISRIKKPSICYPQFVVLNSVSQSIYWHRISYDIDIILISGNLSYQFHFWQKTEFQALSSDSKDLVVCDISYPDCARKSIKCHQCPQARADGRGAWTE